LTLSSLFNALQANDFPVIAIEPYEGSYRVDFAPEATAEQMESTWEFIRNWIPPEQPDWTAFRLAFLSNPAYQRSTLAVAATTSGGLVVQRLENVVMTPEPSIAVVIMLWSNMIAKLPKEKAITPEEVEQWRAIAKSTNVPFTFKEKGVIAVSDS
jgi:hypothetical protein